MDLGGMWMLLLAAADHHAQDDSSLFNSFMSTVSELAGEGDKLTRVLQRCWPCVECGHLAYHISWYTLLYLNCFRLRQVLLVYLDLHPPLVTTLEFAWASFVRGKM